MWSFASLGDVPLIDTESVFASQEPQFDSMQLFSKYHSLKTIAVDSTSHVELMTLRCTHVMCLQALIWVIALTATISVNSILPASGVVGVVVVGVCNRSQMRTSRPKCTYLIFGVSIGLDPG